VIDMQCTVGEVMTTRVARVPPEAPVNQVRRLLRERGVTAVPVVDKQEHLLGVVSAMDLGPGGERPSGRQSAMLRRLRPQRRGGAERATAADRMSRPVIKVAPEVSLRTAARLLQVHDIHHLPVVADGKLVGMVTRRDLLAAFLRTDEQVRRQVVHSLEMTYHLAPNQVIVTVHNGAVRLEGRLELRSHAEEAQRLVGAVDGVTAVDPKLAWEIDDIARDVETAGVRF
jgi:CBS domain-containing protein